ncbi:MAG: hypothetical protein ACRC1H_07065, partial [Caldilineaceae bacterium]
KAKLVIRTLAARNPAASSDPAGAALEAVEFYQTQLATAGGNPALALKRIAVILDMKKNGTQSADFDLGGVKGSMGTPQAGQSTPTMQEAAAKTPAPTQVTARGVPVYATGGAQAVRGTPEYEIAMAALRRQQAQSAVKSPDAPRRPLSYGTIQ